MDFSECAIGFSEGATKLCISKQCSMRNPFICDKCEQTHEHSGTVLAVRINKLKQIYHNIIEKKNRLTAAIEKVENIQHRINVMIADLIAECSCDSNLLADIQVNIQKYLSNDFEKMIGNSKKFFETWEEIKSAEKVIYNYESVSSMVAKIELLTPIINQIDGQTPESTQKIEAKGQGSQFTEQLSNVLCLLNIRLNHEPRPDTIQILKQLAGRCQGRDQLKIIAKICQVCQDTQTSQLIYQKLLAEQPFDIEILSRRALLRKNSNNYAQAYEDYTELIGLAQGKVNPELYFLQRAEICKELGKFQQAEHDYRRYESDVTANVTASKSLAYVLRQQNKYEEASEIYERLVRSERISENEVIEIYRCLANCAKESGDLQQQHKYLSLIEQRIQGDLKSLLMRAPLNHSLGKYVQACEDYSKAIQKIPDNADLYYNRAVSLVYLNKKEVAVQDLQRAVNLSPHFKEAVSLLANTSFELSQSEFFDAGLKAKYASMALSAYEKCCTFAPQNHTIWHNLGILYTPDNLQKAYDCYSKAIELKHDFSASFLGRVKVSLSMGGKAQATLKDIYQLISLGNRHTHIFHIKAILEEEINELQTALLTIKLVVESAPENAQYLQTKIRIQLKANRKEEAVADIQSLYKLSPSKAQKYLRENKQ